MQIPIKTSVFSLFFRSIYAWGLFPLLITGPIFAACLDGFIVELKFDRLEKKTEGVVFRTWESVSSDKWGDQYYAEYSFVTAEGDTVRGQSKISEESHHALAYGAPIPISYVDGQPELNRRTRESRTVFYAGMSVFSFLFVLGAVYIVGKGVKRAAIKSRLLRSGRRAQAKVTEIFDTGTKINDVPQVKLAYVFRDERGKEYQGISEDMARSKVEGYEAGQQITILYDSENPEKSLFIL